MSRFILLKNFFMSVDQSFIKFLNMVVVRSQNALSPWFDVARAALLI